jgi:hypothetical protein
VKPREINLIRTLPACIALSMLLQTVGERAFSVRGSHPVFSFGLTMAVTGCFCILVRLGRMPWFEMKNGEKHGFITWLEVRLPFLRADSYRKRS